MVEMSIPTENEWYIDSLLVSRSMLERMVTTANSKIKLLTSLNMELPDFTKNQKDPGVLDYMMKKLDLNCDGNKSDD
ncbi:hypothetical protein MC885_021748 [Smutsia gigantea]|nr:hypothetical protein MC885_021748 [Smutsia gigantea]